MQGFIEFNENTKSGERDDKDLPFTPDKPHKPVAKTGKYGSAYSTVRHLARQAMQKQAEKMKKEEGGKISVTEEEKIDERNQANALKRKTMDAARGARYKLDNPVPEREPEHKTAQAQNKAIGRALRREEIEKELDENVKKMTTDQLQKQWDQHKDQEHPSPVFAAHLKRVAAELKARKTVKKEEVEIGEGYRGNSEADKPFFAAQDHKKAAEKARKSGDHFSYHKHMSAHHGAMKHWNSNKGRTHVANQHAMKANEHEDYAQQARKGSK